MSTFQSGLEGSGIEASSASTKFPIELVEQIFRTGAVSSRSFCGKLRLVCAWANRLSLPYMLRTVVLPNHATTASFSHLLRGDHHTGGSRRHLVRNLWMEAVSPQIGFIFEACCESLDHVAVNEDAFLWLVHLSTILPRSSDNDNDVSGLRRTLNARQKGLHLTMLTARGRHWSRDDYIPAGDSNISPLFSQITHLHIADKHVEYRSLNLSHFSAVTHLALTYCWYPDWRPGFSKLDRLLNLPSLEVLVLFYDADDIDQLTRLSVWMESQQVEKQILCLTSRAEPLLPVGEWEIDVDACAEGSMWERVDHITSLSDSELSTDGSETGLA